MGGTTSDELNYSNGPTRLCGQDEQYAVDVIQSKGKNRLCVDANIASTTGTPPVLTKKFRLDWNNTETTYVGSSYQTIYSYTGTGFLFGFHLDSDTDKLQVKVIVDGETIFSDLSISFLKEMEFDKAGHGTTFQNAGLISTVASDFDFSPPYPIRFDSSVQIQCKKSDNTNFKIRNYLISIEKES